MIAAITVSFGEPVKCCRTVQVFVVNFRTPEMVRDKALDVLEAVDVRITGAAQGIGEAASRVFSGLGATAIRESGHEALALVMDVTDPNSV